jgi:hypothetical protein
VNSAAVTPQKRALPVARLAEAQLMTRAVHILGLKRPRRHPREYRRPFQIVFRQVHVTLHGAAVNAAALASETNAIHFYS